MIAGSVVILRGELPEPEPGFPNFHGCTSIMVGRSATADGSVITSHTADGGYRTWMAISPHRTNAVGGKTKIYDGRMFTRSPDDERRLKVAGEIPEAPESFAFLDTAYPAINEHQLALGETTVVGRMELRNTNGVFKIEELERLMLERCKTARQAIRLADELTREYGYGDYGECLTIADTKEVWQFEILGATKKHLGAVWAAARIPDDHVGVSANVLRIGEIDLNNADYFMASSNVMSLAMELRWWNPTNGPFKFYKAYSWKKANCGPREWRVLSLAAPSLNLDPNAVELPFSVKAEKKVSVREVMGWFRDTYKNTPLDTTPRVSAPDRKGAEVPSLLVSPWMFDDLKSVFNSLKTNSAPRHYNIPNNTTSYSTVMQLRSWLPDPIGGIVWMGFDNPAQTCRIPLYCGISDLPPSFKVSSQNGFTAKSAAWAFRRAARLSQLAWGKTRAATEHLISDIEDRALEELPSVERTWTELQAKNPERARSFLTAYCNDFAMAATQRYWDFGDDLWDAFAFDFSQTIEERKQYR